MLPGICVVFTSGYFVSRWRVMDL